MKNPDSFHEVSENLRNTVRASKLQKSQKIYPSPRFKSEKVTAKEKCKTKCGSRPIWVIWISGGFATYAARPDFPTQPSAPRAIP